MANASASGGATAAVSGAATVGASRRRRVVALSPQVETPLVRLLLQRGPYWGNVRTWFVLGTPSASATEVSAASPSTVPWMQLKRFAAVGRVGEARGPKVVRWGIGYDLADRHVVRFGVCPSATSALRCRWDLGHGTASFGSASAALTTSSVTLSGDTSGIASYRNIRRQDVRCSKDPSC